MKKIFLLSALALGVMTMSAQIQLEATLSERLWPLSTGLHGVEYGGSQVRYLSKLDSTGRYLSLYDLEKFCGFYKQVDLGDAGYNYEDINFPAKNFWTTDGKVAFVLCKANKTVLLDEDGVERQVISNVKSTIFLLHIRDTYKVYDYTEMKIYGIPGNDTPTDIESPTISIRKSNVQKVIENGQMYIILDGVKYAVTGSTTM